MRSKHGLVTAAMLLGAFAAISRGAAQTPAAALQGRTVPITSTGTPGQPNVAVDAREGFVVTWQERKDDTTTLRYAVISARGQSLRGGHIASGKHWFVNGADFPSLVVLDNGDWVSYWLERVAGGPEAYNIRLVRSRDRGRSWSQPVTPHRDGTATQHGFVALVPAGDDRVLAVWLDGRRGEVAGAHTSHDEHEGVMTLRSAVIDRSGALSEETELDDSTCSCCQVDAARFAGRTVVAYRDRSPDEIRDISVLARSANGAWSKPRTLHPDNWRIEGCPVNGPAVAVNGTRMLVAWTTAASGEMAAKYTIREWDQPGAATLFAPGAFMRGRLDAAAWQQGFLISWIGASGDAKAADAFSGLMLTAVDAAGQPVAQRNVAKLPMSRIGGNPRMAALREHVLLVWSEPAATGRPARIAAELF